MTVHRGLAEKRGGSIVDLIGVFLLLHYSVPGWDRPWLSCVALVDKNEVRIRLYPLTGMHGLEKWLNIQFIHFYLFCFKCRVMYWHTSLDPVCPDGMVTCWPGTIHKQLNSSITHRNWIQHNFPSNNCSTEDAFTVFWSVKRQWLSWALSLQITNTGRLNMEDIAWI